MYALSILDYMFVEEDDYLTHSDVNNRLMYLLATAAVPRISAFMENTVPRFSSQDFRFHFRIDRTTFEVVLETMAPSLESEYPAGKKQVDVEKQLLLFVWYICI